MTGKQLLRRVLKRVAGISEKAFSFDFKK